CSSTLVSSTKSLRRDEGRRVFLAPLGLTTARFGCLAGVAGGVALDSAGWRAAGVSTGAGAMTGSASTASSAMDSTVPIRVGNLGSGMRRRLLVVVVASGAQGAVSRRLRAAPEAPPRRVRVRAGRAIRGPARLWDR